MPDGIRLLHIEDNADYRDLIEATIRVGPGINFEFTGAATLTEGLELFKHTDFDVVLLDWSLGEGTGAESIAALRAIDPNIPIIVFTGHSEAAVIEAARAAGADGLLLKGLTNLKMIVTTLHFAASRHPRRNNRVVTALEGVLAGLESATDSLERHIAWEETETDGH